MTHPPPPSPIERFLGAEAARAGPFGLLHLTPETCTDERIVSALEWQLDRVAQHPEGDTPEADEVRLALHAAAAQLLDPNVRRHLMQNLPERSPGAPSAGPRPIGRTGLEADALRALAAYGGWNSQALERLQALAHARGMGSREVALTLRNLATASARRPPTPTGRRPTPRPIPAPLRQAPGAPQRPAERIPNEPDAAEPTPETIIFDPGTRYVRNVLLGIGGGAVGLLAIVVLGVVLLSNGGSSSNSGQPPAGPSATNPPAAPPKAQSNPAPEEHAAATPKQPETTPLPAKPAKAKGVEAPTGITDPQALVRALAECANLARKEPERAADQFPALVRTLGVRWVKLDQAQRRSADSSVVDCVFATASHTEASSRMMEAICDPARRLAATGAFAPEDTPPSVWSVGILTRLTRERDLPHTVSGTIDQVLHAAIGQDRPRTDATFEAGALAALRRVPERLLAEEGGAPKPAPDARPGEIIRPWIDTLSALAGADAELKERLLADALQRILTSCAEPSADQRVFDSVQTLVTEIKWRRGGAARLRLLDWFRDPKVSLQDLQIVTATLASQSSAEGVDPMMVLSVGATPSDRQRLRSQYAKAWGIAESAGQDKASGEWLSVSKNELARTTEGLRPIELLAMGVTFARLNEAATHLWRGESDQVVDMVQDAVELPGRLVLKITGPTRRVLTQNVEGDGQWMVAYASLGKNAALRQEKLTQMEKYTTAIGPVDAEFLFSLACTESPLDLRASAQRAVIRLAGEASIVNAALEKLPSAPRYSSVAAMYESICRRRLPRPGEAAWELETRRALLARLLELLAGSKEDTQINDLSAVLFDAYAERAGTSTGPDTDSSGESGAVHMLQSAAQLSRAWRADAEAVAPNEYAPVPLDLIDRRKQGRLRLAQGPVQLFAAEQVTTAELMAYVLSAEHPRLARQVKDVIDEMSQSRRQARHIFEQIACTERAMLQLWRLRLGGDQP